MTTKEELFEKLGQIAETDTKWHTDTTFLIENEDWLDYSLQVASLILARLRELGWKQVDLADEMNVKPQQVNKWVKGKENFQLSTLIKLQSALGIPLITIADKKTINAARKRGGLSKTSVSV
jgi:ribosome-binding protein aMBF1 (putative translation factor)